MVKWKNGKYAKIAELLNIKSSQVQKVLELTAEGNTVPFIARYRKEVTGSLDEVEIKKLLTKMIV